MHSSALELLKILTKKNATRQTRSLDLLKPLQEGDSGGWFMYVPSCFNEALDIRQTERVKDGKKSLCWTQGAFFSFKQGDTIYDTPKAYEHWSKALKHINICVSVKAATDVSLGEDGKSRSPGSVTFIILKPNKQRTKLVEHEQRTMTQDEFVKFLIIGEEKE